MTNLVLIGFQFWNRPFPNHGPRDIIIDRLQFDDSQVKEYDKLISIHQKSVREADKQIAEIKSQLYTSLDSNTVYTDSLINEINSIQKKIETIHIKHFKDISLLCHTDQLDEFEKLSHDLAALFGRKKPN